MKILVYLFFLGSFLNTKAQNDLKDNELFYSFSIGPCIGSAPNFEYGNIGIGGMLDFNLQKNKSLATLSYHATGEFVLLAAPNPSTTMSGLDVMYGREITNKKIRIEMNAGLGLVSNLERGNLLYTEPSFFGPSHYEKIRSYSVGFPISTKISFGNRKDFNLGIEAYFNINK